MQVRPYPQQLDGDLFELVSDARLRDCREGGVRIWHRGRRPREAPTCGLVHSSLIRRCVRLIGPLLQPPPCTSKRRIDTPFAMLFAYIQAPGSIAAAGCAMRVATREPMPMLVPMPLWAPHLLQPHPLIVGMLSCDSSPLLRPTPPVHESTLHRFSCA
jgi:hypothetical protein